MKLNRWWAIVIVATCFFSSIAPCLQAMESEASAAAVEGWFKKKKKNEVKDSVSTKNDYQKLTSDEALVSRGVFNVFHKDNNYYFEIPTALLGRDMLVVNKLQRVPAELNEAGVNRGTNYESQMIRFEWDRMAEKIMIRQSRALPLSPVNDAIHQSVADNYISPLIAAFKVEALNADSTSVVFKVNDIYDGTETSINNVFTNINLGTSAIKNLSRITSVKSFHNNVIANAELTTKVTEGTTTIYVTVEVSSSILLLSKEPMMGRLDNQRVGYFTNPLLTYTDAQQRVSTTHYITRWRLEPRAEDRTRYLKGELVEPEKPIVFYIDHSTPYQWRKYIKQGIEDWQIAFEKAGFKNAIRVDELPDSTRMPEDDLNYSVLTYSASEKSNAMGPSILDPRSGEILEADIMWWHNVIDMVKEWITVQTGAVREEARLNELPTELMGDAIRFVACHEVGHSLGLRHNMMASWAYQTDSLRNEAFTTRMNGTSSSIMDYARFNYVAQPGDGVKVLSPHIGPYDIFAIEYGYRWYGKDTPEAEKEDLAEFMARHTSRLYKYSEAQDVRDAVDPRAQIEDLGDDAIRSSQLGIENLKKVVPNIIKWTTTGEKEQTYEEASKLYYAVINQWNNYLYHVLANIGGIYLENTTVGDGQKTYTFVEREKQKAAMKFLLDEVLTYPKWLFDTEVGQYTYLLRNTPVGKVENAPTQVLKNAQAWIVWDLLGNNRLMRMFENETVNGKKAYTAVEMMDDLHRSIFATTERGVVPDVLTRALQKNFVDALITAAAESEGVKINKKLANDRNVVMSPFETTEHFLLANHQPLCSCDEYAAADERMGAPRTINFYGSQITRVSDAISVKRGELLRVKELLERRKHTSDLAAQYHYQDLLLRIRTALGLK